MKTTILLSQAAIHLLLAASGLGQASFALRNRYDGIDAPVFDAHGVPLAGTNYLVELWGGATPDSLAPARVLDEGFRRETIPFGNNGYFTSTAGYLSVLGVTLGGFAWLEVRAWDTRLADTYEAAFALGVGGYGESPIFYAQGGNPVREPPEPPYPLLGLQSFSLRPVVPEPSVGAMLALGGTTLWYCMYRRRRG